MALQFQHVDPNFYKLDENEIEVILEAEQEAGPAAENGNFEGPLNGPEKLKNQGIPDHKDDVIHYIGDDIKDESHGSHQGSGHPQLEKQENLAAARVPQFRRTRPRIQLGLTPRQLSELEEVFEQTKYPDETTRYVACFSSQSHLPSFSFSFGGVFSTLWPLSALSPKARRSLPGSLMGMGRMFCDVQSQYFHAMLIWIDSKN